MHCTEGRITLDEFSDRVGHVFNARTDLDLDEALSDLPMPWDDDPTAIIDRDDPARRRRRPVRWLVAVFGSSAQRGRYRLDDECVAIAVFGDCVLDLTKALIDGAEPVITAVAAFGDVVIVVPDGIEVDVDGVAIFGSKRSEASTAPVVPGSPVIRVHAFAVFGDVLVRPPSRRGGRR
jgi:hypothetical protein